jgi:hypothetical protein
VQHRVPKKLTRLIELTLANARARVKINNEYTKEFKVKTGVKPGDPLSAAFFSIVVDVILKKLNLRGNISIHLKQCYAYAGDTRITIRTQQSPTDIFQ